MWITHEDAKGTLLGISIESGDVVHRLEFDWIYDILFDGERLWVAFDEGGPWSMKAAAVDPNDGSIDLYYTEGYSVEFLAHDGDSLWFGSNYRSKELSESDAGALVRLDRWGGGQVL